MSVRDITPVAVREAVDAGFDDIDKLAAYFEVLHVSHTLRSTIAGLKDDGGLRVAFVRADGTKVLEVTR